MFIQNTLDFVKRLFSLKCYCYTISLGCRQAPIVAESNLEGTKILEALC